MSWLKKVRRKAELKPPRVLIHGVHGVGKTTWAASAPNPVFLCLEDGLGILDVDNIDLTKPPEPVPNAPVKTHYQHVLDVIGELYTGDHDYQTLVIDSLDWLEPIIWQDTCVANGWKDIEAPGYGRGYVAALDRWRQIRDGLDAIRNDRGMSVVMIAHTVVKTFNSPESEPYDRYEIKLHKAASGLMQEHADCVFFANYKVSVAKTETGFKKVVTRGVGRGSRVVYTAERPAFLAKNRYALPDSIDMDTGFAGFMELVANSVSHEQIVPENQSATA